MGDKGRITQTVQGAQKELRGETRSDQVSGLELQHQLFPDSHGAFQQGGREKQGGSQVRSEAEEAGARKEIISLVSFSCSMILPVKQTTESRAFSIYLWTKEEDKFRVVETTQVLINGQTN